MYRYLLIFVKCKILKYCKGMICCSLFLELSFTCIRSCFFLYRIYVSCSLCTVHITCKFLSAFSKFLKEAIDFVMAIRLSVRMEQLVSHWTDFDEIWDFRNFRKSLATVQVSLKSVEYKRYFTWRPLHIFYHISLISFYNEKYLRQML